MELKLINRFLFISIIKLLIVPYGIETARNYNRNKGQDLLIVPYGIETTYSY